MYGTVIYIMVPVHPQLGQSPATCYKLSETQGAMSYDAFGTACWKVYGKAIQINPLEHDVEEAVRITNFNFNANGKVKAVELVEQLPGPRVLDV